MNTNQTTKPTDPDAEWDMGASPNGFSPESTIHPSSQPVSQLESQPVAVASGEAPEASKTSQISKADLSAPAPAEQPQEKRSPIRKRIVTALEVVAALAVAKQAQADFRQVHGQLATLLHPQAMATAIEEEMGGTTDPDMLARLRAMHAEYTGPGALVAEQRARGLIRTAVEPFRVALLKLVEAAAPGILNLEIEAEVAEEAFFTGFGLRREPTAVSRRLQAEAQTIAGFRKALLERDSAQAHVMPHEGAYAHFIEWFEG